MLRFAQFTQKNIEVTQKNIEVLSMKLDNSLECSSQLQVVSQRLEKEVDNLETELQVRHMTPIVLRLNSTLVDAHGAVHGDARPGNHRGNST